MDPLPDLAPSQETSDMVLNWLVPWSRKFRATLRLGPRYMAAVGAPSGEDLEVVTKLVEEGALRAVVDRVFDLEDVRCGSLAPIAGLGLGLW